MSLMCIGGDFPPIETNEAMRPTAEMPLHTIPGFELPPPPRPPQVTEMEDVTLRQLFRQSETALFERPYMTFRFFGYALFNITRARYDQMPLIIQGALDDCMVVEKRD